MGKDKKKLSRRDFLAALAAGTAVIGAAACKTPERISGPTTSQPPASSTPATPGPKTTLTPSALAETTSPPKTATAAPSTTSRPVTSTLPGTTHAGPLPATKPGAITYTSPGFTTYGTWNTDLTISPPAWQPGQSVAVTARLRVTQGHLANLARRGYKADGFCALLTAERSFDADGGLRLPSDERMSTLLTPTGLGIEGGVQGAVTTRFGYGFRTPVDELASQLLTAAVLLSSGEYETTFVFNTVLPKDLPPGIYRLRLDYGFTIKTARYSLSAESFTKRPAANTALIPPTESFVYSPPVRASGTHVSGRVVDAAVIKPRVPWALLRNYNSNGYLGVVADEDKATFAISGRNLIQDEVILPLYSADNKTILSYSLEPQFPADTIESRCAIPWDYTRGEISIQVTAPDGKTADLGTAPFTGNAGVWPTTKKPAVTAWKPAQYGQYTVKATGWTADIWGNRYEGGGTYHFWIAKRMTMATATFQGFAYPVGTKYGRDIGFAPAGAADVDITATLYPDSDTARGRSISFTGRASPGGIYGTLQGMQQLTLDAAGEYHTRILARYTDQEGHLWVCAMRHAGVVYPPDTPIIARGKKLSAGEKLVDRGETHLEGWVESPDVLHLQHINYPFQAGDVLLIASEQQGSNKIEPVLTYETKINPAPWDAALQTIGITNLRFKTSNGYSPHLFPEYITDRAYYYAGAPRPGFMSRFLVSEDGARAPYWPTSPNAFGGQVNASNNGDLPGDIYRLIGGVVLRKQGEAPAYAGYLASAFLLPRGSQNNRIIAAGSEDVNGPYGQKGRFFLVGTRPGMVYETGTLFAPAVQIDPVLPVNIRFELAYPDGRRAVATGTGDAFGSFAGATRWPLDIPGVYYFWLEGEWQGYRGYMPGLPPGGGVIYVIEKERPADAPRLRINLAEQSAFTLPNGLVINGQSTANTVYYAAVIPGSVVDQGALPVSGGKFQYVFDPAAINRRNPNYDTVNLVSGKAEVFDVVHLTFFARETATSGVSFHSFLRLIIRGSTIIQAY